MVTPGARRRAVVLVGGPAAPYSRAIRVSRALAAEGFAVEIAAVASPGLPGRETVRPGQPGSAGLPEPAPGAVGSIELRRYGASGPWAIVGVSEAASGPRVATDDDGVSAGPGGAASSSRSRRLIRAVARPFLDLRRWLLWPHAVRGWWSTLASDLAPADLYHACGSLTIAAALAARDRSPSGPSGRPARVVYDSVDIAAESNTVTAMPRAIRRRIARKEAGWARAADAVVTINEPFAERLGGRWHLARGIEVVPNMPEPPDPALLAGSPDLLREAAGLDRAIRVVLFQGRLGPNLGLEAAAEAILDVPDAALVILGFGRGMAASRERDRDPRYAGRHVTLDARPPDELVAWTASADVCLIPLPPVSVNQRLTTPNKFWEAVIAGTPVVVVRGMTTTEELVREHDFGLVAESAEPADLAAAIRASLDRLAGPDGRAWRTHIAAVAAERFGWPPAATRYRALVRELVGP